MSLRAIPLIILAFIMYNVVVFLGGAPDANDVLRKVIFSMPSFRQAPGGVRTIWNFTWGDLILLVTMVLLFIELLKSTYTASSSLVDHALSMLVFVACLVEFLLVDKAFTSVFFLVMISTLIDVIAGYTIGIQVAKRDLSIGGSS